MAVLTVVYTFSFLVEFRTLLSLHIQHPHFFFIKSSTLLCGSTLYCLVQNIIVPVHTSARYSRNCRSKEKRLWFSIISGSRSRTSWQNLAIIPASSSGF